MKLWREKSPLPPLQIPPCLHILYTYVHPVLLYKSCALHVQDEQKFVVLVSKVVHPVLTLTEVIFAYSCYSSHGQALCYSSLPGSLLLKPWPGSLLLKPGQALCYSSRARLFNNVKIYLVSVHVADQQGQTCRQVSTQWCLLSPRVQGTSVPHHTGIHGRLVCLKST